MVELVTEKELELLTHKDIVRFALFCAEYVRHKTDCVIAHKCIEVVGKWLVGKASEEECKIAAADAFAIVYAAYASAYAPAAASAASAASAADYAAYAAAAANAVYAAANAADNKKEFLVSQRNYYNELLNFNEIFEKEVLND